MNLVFLLALALSIPTVALACRDDSDCCAGAKCMYPRGAWNNQTSQVHVRPRGRKQLECVLPGDQMCPQCPFGFGYVFGVCTPFSFPCQESPCPADKACVYKPKTCVTARKCRQHVCVDPEEACPQGTVLLYVESYCS